MAFSSTDAAFLQRQADKPPNLLRLADACSASREAASAPRHSMATMHFLRSFLRPPSSTCLTMSRITGQIGLHQF